VRSKLRLHSNIGGWSSIHFLVGGLNPSEKYEAVGKMTFPTEWKVINNSMVPLLIIISHYIILYTIKNTIIFHYSQLNGKKIHGSSHHQPDPVV
jgi:hypothetical protein